MKKNRLGSFESEDLISFLNKNLNKLILLENKLIMKWGVKCENKDTKGILEKICEIVDLIGVTLESERQYNEIYNDKIVTKYAFPLSKCSTNIYPNLFKIREEKRHLKVSIFSNLVNANNVSKEDIMQRLSDYIYEFNVLLKKIRCEK
ncbi:hypothetical protein [Alteromonas sp. RKMC-009]|uniref:hypothetical protein n=1 Tax=Alteromonas sp. RKMC-009 TaxID=2267264 RepID=UPI000F0D08B4|nr:hypothetical protein [Alteromonas sp. RKMC-009]AYN07660.1 hypothetical protein DS731_21950 [Alteromonas sp. RKMC-009]